MSRLAVCIQKLSQVATSVEHDSDTLEAYQVESDLVIKSLSISTRNTSDTLHEVIRELLELQQVQDLELAIQQGVV